MIAAPPRPDPADAPKVRPAESRRAAAHPVAPVRGDRWLRRGEAAGAWLDGWLARWLPAEHNLLAQAGPAANVALLVAVVTGVLLLPWYSPSHQFAYASLQAVAGRTLGGWVRALHRYSSDLAMLLILIHAGRVFFARKFVEARWLAWLSGIALLAVVWFIGWTGYWLVWDQPAQQVAVSSMQLLDALPLFGEPLGRLYVSDRTVPSLLFFVVFFLHMLLPLGIAIGLAVHLARLSRARLLPARLLSSILAGALALAALAVPAPLDDAAQMTAKPAALTVDAWYLSPLALALRFQHAGLWVALAGGIGLGAAIPWLLGRRRAPQDFQAVVSPERCHACTQCQQDCPFDAIAMVARTDGKRLPSQAWVDPTRCVGCGVCGGSCDSEGIALGWFDTRAEESRIAEAIRTCLSGGGPAWVAFVAGEITTDVAPLPGYQIFRVPTASWVRPKFLEHLFANGLRGALIVRDARTEAWARDGGRWVEARLRQERKPALRPERSAGGRGQVVDFDPARPDQLLAAAARFRAGGESTRSRRPALAAVTGAATALAVTALAVGPSHLRVPHPAAPTPELVISFKAFGTRQPAAAVDPAAEAAKPIHMRGRTADDPSRAEVVVRLTLDGALEQRAYSAKGISHDGPAMAEWRRPLIIGRHQLAVEIVTTPGSSGVRWSGTIEAVHRRINVISYDPTTGFLVE